MPIEQQVSLEQLAVHLRGLNINRVILEEIQHHTWSPTVANYYATGGLACVRGVRRYHMAPPPNGRGWSDNGYHIMVGPDGAVYLCRPISKSGGHCLGHNSQSIGISLIGNYDTGHDAPPEQWPGYRALISTVALVCRRFNIPVNRIYPHSAFADKSCPGTGFAMPRFRQEVQAAMANEIKPNLRIIDRETGNVIPCNPRIENGVTRVDLRPFAEAMAIKVYAEHLDEQGKIYVE